MTRISFQVQVIPGEKKFKDFQENFETIMETLLYLQNAFPKIIEDLEDPEDRYGVDVIIAFDADHIEAPDGQKGFGVFDIDTDTEIRFNYSLNWEKLGLTSPMQPEEMPDYRFSDLEMKLYYRIKV